MLTISHIYKKTTLKLFLLLGFFMFWMPSAYALTNFINKAQNMLGDGPVSNIEGETTSLQKISITADLSLGNRHAAVEALKYHWGMSIVNDRFDHAFQVILREKQSEVGLTPTGVLDTNSWYALAPHDEVWRQSALDAGIKIWTNIIDQHKNHENPYMVVINIAAGMLYVYNRQDDGSYIEVFNSKVVVGKPSSKTPLENLEIISLKYNPTWTPTPRMLARNVFRDGSFNPTWLKQRGVLAFNQQGENVDWSAIDNPRNFTYTQPPGDNNALGNLKFETTSNKMIYLHDTNTPNLFNHNTRAYSAGCIRVEQYRELAALLGKKEQSAVDASINRKRTHWIRLPKRVPVYFDTSLVRGLSNVSLSFSADIYNLHNSEKPKK